MHQLSGLPERGRQGRHPPNLRGTGAPRATTACVLALSDFLEMQSPMGLHQTRSQSPDETLQWYIPSQTGTLYFYHLQNWIDDLSSSASTAWPRGAACLGMVAGGLFLMQPRSPQSLPLIQPKEHTCQLSISAPWGQKKKSTTGKVIKNLPFGQFTSKISILMKF